MIAIIDYGAGNVRSVQNALRRIGADSVLTEDPTVLLSADKVIFPGVGEARFAMQQLHEKRLVDVIRNIQRPLLGICLGQQLLCSHSEEGNTECLGIFDAFVKRFPPKEKVPHVGWNDISQLQGELFRGVSEEANFYFVHSYYCEPGECTTALCDYILPFSAAMQKDNFYATQFHPEKSGDMGEIILKNFISL